MADYLLHIRAKSHVEHTICFIEDEDLHMSEWDNLLIDQIEQSSWCGDEDVYSPTQDFHLIDLWDTAKDDRIGQITIFPIIRKALGYLDSEFSGGSEDESTDRSMLRSLRLCIE